MRRGIRNGLLRALAGILCALPLLAAAPVAASNGRMIITLSPDRTDVTVTANREQSAGAAALDHINLTYDSGSHTWKSGPIDDTDALTCDGENRTYMFDIVVKDKGGNVVGTSAKPVYVCGSAVIPTQTIKVDPASVGGGGGGGGGPPSTDGTLTGRITYVDVTDNSNTERATSGVQITLDDGHGNGYQTQTSADGSYRIGGIKPGSYTLTVQGSSLANAGNGQSVRIYTQVVNFVIGAGPNTFSYKADPRNGDDLVPKEIPDCSSGALDWLICNPIRFALNIIDWIRDNVLAPFLQEKPINASGADAYSKGLYDVWSAIRNLANVAFIVIFVLVIFGTAIGYDNYTVKKVLPRLVAAVVLVQLSFLLSSLIVDAGNVLGQGLAVLGNSIIPAPKIDFTQNWSAKGIFLGSGLLGVAGGVAAVVAISAAAIGSMLLGMFVLFLTLVLRKVFILALIVVAPIAFVLWVLPNTDQYFKKWYQSLAALALMYPMIIGLFEAGRLFAKAAELSGGDGSFGSTSLAPIFVIAGYAIPLLLAPLTVLAAGKVMTAGVGGLQKLSGKLDPKNSDAAQRRAQNRQYRSAVVARQQPTSGFGHVRRAVASKRGGFGWKASAAQQQKMETIAEKGINDRAKAQAQRADRGQYGMQSADAAIGARARVLQDSMLDQSIAQAAYGKTESGQTIRTASLSETGIQELCNVIRSALASNNQATAIAAMQRLSTTKEGIHALQGMRTSSFGGTDFDLVGAGFDAAGQERYKTMWDKGTSGAKAVDIRKPPASAFRDVSQAEFANMTVEEATRAVDYFDRNINAAAPAGASTEQVATIEKNRAAAVKGAAEFNATAQKALANPKMLERMAPEMVKAVVAGGVKSPNVIHPATTAAAQKVAWNQGSTPAGYRVDARPAGPSEPYRPSLLDPHQQEQVDEPHDPRTLE